MHFTQKKKLGAKKNPADCTRWHDIFYRIFIETCIIWDTAWATTTPMGYILLQRKNRKKKRKRKLLRVLSQYDTTLHREHRVRVRPKTKATKAGYDPNKHIPPWGSGRQNTDGQAGLDKRLYYSTYFKELYILHVIRYNAHHDKIPMILWLQKNVHDW